MANIELDGPNKKIKVDSGDLTLDVPGDIVLDADGGDVVFADGGTNLLKVTNSSSDVVLQPQVDTKDIVFKQYDGTVVATVEDNATFNIPASKLAIGGTAVTATAAEINLIDGGTARGTTAIADGDGVLINDAGTMRQTTVETLKTYIGGFDVSSITGATALAEEPALTDEMVISDAGTLKRVDITHVLNTPGFLAKLSSDQTLSNNTWTKLALASELSDKSSTYDASTNYRFSPATAGLYHVGVGLGMESVGADDTVSIQVYKNGSAGYYGRVGNIPPIGATVYMHTDAVFLLDNNDYLEFYAIHNVGADRSLSANTTYAYGYRITGTEV
jgi:hypothetical protein